MAARTAFTEDQRTAFAVEAQATSPSTVATRIGVPSSVVRKWLYRHRQSAALPVVEAPPLAPTFEPVDVETAPEVIEPFRLGGTAADRRVVALEDEVRRLRQELRKAHRDGLDEDAVREILGGIAAAPTKPPAWLDHPSRKGAKTPEVPMTIWSDWHGGETVSFAETNGVNAFDVATLDRRVQTLVDNTIDICREHGPGTYPGIVVNLLGDFVSGGLHPELAKTDELEIIPTVLHLRDLLVTALTRIADAFGQVYCPCAAGNHGRGTPKPEFKRYVHKNFDWLIFQLLARHFADDPRISFDIRESNEVFYRVYGVRFLAMHGDMLGVKGGDGLIGSIGPIMRGEIKTRGAAASSGMTYDVLLMGHYHQMIWLQRAIVAGSLKGWDEYAKNALRAPISDPSQPLWFVHPRYGITMRLEVRVEEPAARGDAAWVSVFDPSRRAA